MTSPVARICLMLAASDLTEEDMRAFSRWLLLRGGASGLATTVQRLRRLAEADDADLRRSKNHDTPPSLSRRTLEDVALKIENLLVYEVSMTRTRAADLIESELRKEGFKDLPVYGKSSFSSWISKITETVPSSLLLHVASRLRNSLVHEKDTDWPLRKNNEGKP